jgi:hypothetical protein
MSQMPIGEKLDGRVNGTAMSGEKTARIATEARNRRVASLHERNPTRSSAHPDHFPIIVHCHLCWDWVWQRPQQFLSRLSEKHKILFVETVGPDPQLAAPYAWFKAYDGFPNLTVLRIQFPAWQWSDGEFVDRERRRLVQQALKSERLAGQFENPVQWFYDPMAVTAFAGHMNESATVYDCMDELSRFKGAPPAIVEREQRLLAHADVVLTRGPKNLE